MQYRRAETPGGTYFFTVNLADRRSETLVDHFPGFRETLRSVMSKHPFEIPAMVVLPEHLHAIWKLPENDADYPKRVGRNNRRALRRIELTNGVGASHPRPS